MTNKSPLPLHTFYSPSNSPIFFFFTACITNQNYTQYVFASCLFSISCHWNVNSLIHSNTSNRILCKAGPQQLLFKWMTLSPFSLSKYSPNSCLGWNLAVLWRPCFPWSFLKEKELTPLHRYFPARKLGPTSGHLSTDITIGHQQHCKMNNPPKQTKTPVLWWLCHPVPLFVAFSYRPGQPPPLITHLARGTKPSSLS